jgi:hypothetical protein
LKKGFDMYKSVAEFFRAADGKRVTRTIQPNVITLDEWAAIRAAKLREGAIEDSSGTLRLLDGRFIMRPRQWRVDSGILTTKSGEYKIAYEKAGLTSTGARKGCLVDDTGIITVWGARLMLAE